MSNNCKTTFESEVNKFNTLDFNPGLEGFIWKDRSGNIMPDKKLTFDEKNYVFDMEGVIVTEACWEYIKEIIKNPNVVMKDSKSEGATADTCALLNTQTALNAVGEVVRTCLLYTSPSPRD